MKVPEGPLSFERLRFPYKGYCDLCERGLEGEANKPIIEWQLETQQHGIYLLCDRCKKALS